MLRDHQPIVFDKFNLLWARNETDNTPLDHFQDCNNIKAIGTSSFGTRDGVGISQTVSPLSNIRRIYNYPTQTGNTLIVLTYDSTNGGRIYHVVSPTLTYGPLLSIATMTDFAFVPYNGRAYISPFKTYTVTALDGTTLNIEKGIQSESLYVYLGDGTVARAAAGAGPSSTVMTIANGAAGNTDSGFHLFGAVYEYNTGYLSPVGAITGFTTSPGSSVSFGSIPTSGNATITKVHLVTTKVITSYNGDNQGYTFYFIPNAFVTNGTTSLNNQSFFDADLLEDASHLLDNYTTIPAGCSLTLYHNRLCVSGTYTDISLTLVSTAGEPEAINQIDGLLIVPPDGNPITNAREFRDILYVFKRTRTVAFIDNGDVPSTWNLSIIDNALGTCVHGIATVLDSGSSNIDFLIICTFQGVNIFNGRYINPEMTWKIESYWQALDRNLFGKIQIVNAPIQKQIYIVLPTNVILVGNYSNGFDSRSIRWAPWSFSMIVNSIAIANISDIILGADIS